MPTHRPATAPTVVAYLRVSVTREDSTSIAVQEKAIRDRAAFEGWHVAHVITDDGVSGAKNREGTDAVLAMIRSGAASIIATYKLDRWTRSGVAVLGDLIRALDETPGARFVGVADGLDSTQAAWEIIAPVLAGIAKIERENIRTRVTASIAERKTTGRWTGGRPPYGYASAPSPDGPGRVLVVAPEEAAIVHEAAERVRAGGSVYSIARDFNARGIPTRNGGTWTIQAVRQCLTGDAIVGRVRHRGQLIRGEDGLPLSVWEPVLALDEWHAVADALPARPPKDAPTKTRASRSHRLLAGIVSCVLCGSKLYPKTDGRGVVAYACQARSNGRPCRGVSASADRLEEYIADRFLEEVGNLPVYVRQTRTPAAVDLIELDRAIAATRDAEEAAGDDEEAALVAFRQRRELTARRAALVAENTVEKVELVATGRTYRETWESAELAERKAMLAANVAVLSVGSGKRGRTGAFDGSRVTLVSQPAFPLDADPETFTPSTVVAP